MKTCVEYISMIEKQKDIKKGHSQPTTLSLSRTIVSDFTPEALLQAHDANPRGIAIYVDEIMGMFNSVNQYSKELTHRAITYRIQRKPT